MKKNVLLYFTFFLFNQLSVAQYEQWNVISIQRTMYSINFLSHQKGWVFCGDFAFKTTDAGSTWSRPIRMDYKVGIPSATGYNSYTDYISFVDTMYGWAAQNSNILLKTINGGNIWSPANTNLNSCDFSAVHFINRMTGWAAGKSQNLGIVAKTTNGGANWIIKNSQIRGLVSSFQMVSSNKGFLTYGNTDSIAMTEDDWVSIIYTKVGNGQPTKKVLFIDSLNGWVIGSTQYVSKTTDGGQNWSMHTYTNFGNAVNVYFKDNFNGWSIFTMGSMLKTTNSGVNWSKIINWQGQSPTYDLLDVFFENLNTGWCSSYSGVLYKSTNGGMNWFKNIPIIQGRTRIIDFTEENIGWALSDFRLIDHDASYLWKTTDRGYSWNELDTFTSMNSIDFIDNNTGYLCGNAGMIYKTINGGNDLMNIGFGYENYYSISFLNAITGYICGEGGRIIKTVNGGINWSELQSNIFVKLNDVQYTDNSSIIAVGDSGKIVKTTNEGLNWIAIQTENVGLQSVCFVNSITGYIVGNRHGNNPWPASDMIILKSTNSGLNWSIVQNSFQFGYHDYNDVKFVNESTGYVVMGRDTKGYIIRTTDAGLSWVQTFELIGNGTSEPGSLTCISILNDRHMWVGGYNGTIVSTVSPVGIQSVGAEIPIHSSLFQNYPNPFNPQTKIKFDIPSNVKGQTSNVKLIIYDLLGREVTTLVDEELKPGTYEVDWDCSNYSSGVYFYKIITEGFVETKKMVLMK